MRVVYKITYPNGKIYVGQDRANSIGHFASPNNALIAQIGLLESRRLNCQVSTLTGGYA